MNSFAKDIGAVLKSRGTVIISGIVTSMITGRYLGPEGNGVVAALTVYPAIFMTIGSLGIRQSTAYFVGQQKYDDSDIFSSVLYIWIFTNILCLSICFLLLKFVVKGHYPNDMIFLALIPIPFSLLTTYASGLFLGKNQIKDFNTVNWVPNVVKLVSYVLLIMIIPWDIYGALIGIVASYFFLTYFVYKKVRKMVTIHWRYNHKLVKEMLSLGIVYATSLLIINLNYKLDVALLERLSSAFEVGIYTKGVSIVENLWEVPTILSTVIFARSAVAKDGRSFSLKVGQLLRICFVVILLMSVSFFFLSRFMMVSLYGVKFAASATVQKLLLPGILLLTIFKVLNMDLAGKGKPWVAVWAMIPSLIINVVLNWIWDAKYGANGASVASAVSYSVSAIVFLFMYSKSVDIPVKEILRFSRSDYDFLDKYIDKLKLKLNAKKG